MPRKALSTRSSKRKAGSDGVQSHEARKKKKGSSVDDKESPDTSGQTHSDSPPAGIRSSSSVHTSSGEGGRSNQPQPANSSNMFAGAHVSAAGTILNNNAPFM